MQKNVAQKSLFIKSEFIWHFVQIDPIEICAQHMFIEFLVFLPYWWILNMKMYVIRPNILLFLLS